MGPDKAFRMVLISLAENLLALLNDFVGPAIMQRLWCQQADAAVMVFGVVPGEEKLTEAAGILDGAEAVRELWPVFQGFELRLRERVVVGDMGPGVGLGDTEIGE